MMPTTAADIDERQFDAWNPGISSRIPDDLRHLCTLFRAENVLTSLATASEISDLFGLEATEIVAVRPSRLALHELLIRVTAEFSVPDGDRIEDLGINFRRMTRVLLERHIEPQMPAITATYDSVRRTAAAVIERELARLVPATSPASGVMEKPKKAGLFARFARLPAAPLASDGASTRSRAWSPNGKPDRTPRPTRSRRP